jgi:hypothetical protein
VSRDTILSKRYYDVNRTADAGEADANDRCVAVKPDIEQKIAEEERKYLVARRKLEAIRIMDFLFERLKVTFHFMPYHNHEIRNRHGLAEIGVPTAGLLKSESQRILQAGSRLCRSPCLFVYN